MICCGSASVSVFRAASSGSSLCFPFGMSSISLARCSRSTVFFPASLIALNNSPDGEGIAAGGLVGSIVNTLSIASLSSGGSSYNFPQPISRKNRANAPILIGSTATSLLISKIVCVPSIRGATFAKSAGRSNSNTRLPCKYTT